MRGCILFLAFTVLVTTFGCKTSELTSGEKQPAITSISPAQVSRGQQNIPGRILGSNFVGIVAVDLDAGIKIHATTILSATELEVLYSVNGDAPTGKRSIRVATPAGVATTAELFTINDNRAPNAVFNMSPNKGAKDTLFSFDASGSNDPDGNVNSYHWDFGDGASDNGKQTTHRYNAAGNFKVKLTVTDNHQSASTNQRDVLVENISYPIARFSYSPHAGPITKVFQFDGSGSADRDGRIVDYDWNFKDGTSARGKVVNHKFKRVDHFEVELKVKDNSGLVSSVSKMVEIKGQAPVAGFSFSPSSGQTSTVFQFNASRSTDDSGIARYEWNFGDNKTGAGKTVTHQYSSTGNFTVRLTVVDVHGMTDTDAETVSVGSGGGGGGIPGGTPVACTNPAPGRGFIYGTVIGVKGQWAITRLDPGATCADSFYKCGDFRKANTGGRDEFFGIIKQMNYLGNSVFEIYNDCPLKWPPAIGEKVFLYWKPCSKNFCPAP